MRYGLQKLELQNRSRRLNDIELKNEAIPMILQGDNIICAAETGSGKTFAYLVPLVDKAPSKSPSRGSFRVLTGRTRTPHGSAKERERGD
ncbi:hypothetical protein BV898_19118 [Hypsibius exemplaris]|uniref:DEAD/DEAH-box helicase domain-containing protein n=1 Tax=Hypsibius exemplaris TaxID=2072580 RepID=A0A9X6NIG1_HYPEX|nr:hypothetical protein BV898_19118 [Hypsibius exemplaris]